VCVMCIDVLYEAVLYGNVLSRRRFVCALKNQRGRPLIFLLTYCTVNDFFVKFTLRII
jgi:hypothetical protein